MPDKVKVAFAVPTRTPILYPVAPLAGSAQRRRWRSSFVDFLLAPPAQAVLATPRLRQALTPRAAIADGQRLDRAGADAEGGRAGPPLLNLVLGVGVGYALARWRFPGRDLLDAVLTLPMVMPPTVLGYYLLVVIGSARPDRRAGCCSTSASA